MRSYPPLSEWPYTAKQSGYGEAWSSPSFTVRTGGARVGRGVTDLEPNSGRPNAWILRGRRLERAPWRRKRFHPFFRPPRVSPVQEAEPGSWTPHGARTGGGAEKAVQRGLLREQPRDTCVLWPSPLAGGPRNLSTSYVRVRLNRGDENPWLSFRDRDSGTRNPGRQT